MQNLLATSPTVQSLLASNPAVQSLLVASPTVQSLLAQSSTVQSLLGSSPAIQDLLANSSTVQSLLAGSSIVQSLLAGNWDSAHLQAQMISLTYNVVQFLDARTGRTYYVLMEGLPGDIPVAVDHLSGSVSITDPLDPTRRGWGTYVFDPRSDMYGFNVEQIQPGLIAPVEEFTAAR